MVIHVHGKDELVVQFRVPAPFEKTTASAVFFFFRIFLHLFLLSLPFLPVPSFPSVRSFVLRIFSLYCLFRDLLISPSPVFRQRFHLFLFSLFSQFTYRRSHHPCQTAFENQPVLHSPEKKTACTAGCHTQYQLFPVSDQKEIRGSLSVSLSSISVRFRGNPTTLE